MNDDGKNERNVMRHWRLKSPTAWWSPLKGTHDTNECPWHLEAWGRAIFSRSALPRSSEIPNLSVINDSARLNSWDQDHRRDQKSPSRPHLQHSKWMDEFKSSMTTYRELQVFKEKQQNKNLSVKQGSDPGWIQLFDVSAAHSCHHGNLSLKGSN